MLIELAATILAQVSDADAKHEAWASCLIGNSISAVETPSDLALARAFDACESMENAIIAEVPASKQALLSTSMRAAVRPLLVDAHAKSKAEFEADTLDREANRFVGPVRTGGWEISLHEVGLCVARPIGIKSGIVSVSLHPNETMSFRFETKGRNAIDFRQTSGAIFFSDYDFIEFNAITHYKTHWSMSTYPEQFQKASMLFAQGSQMRLLSNGTIVAEGSLSGSAEALKHLERCHAEIRN